MSLQEKFGKLEAHLKRLVVGQERLLNRMLVALLSRRPPARRRRAGSREDARDQGVEPQRRRRLPSPAVHAGPAAGRPHGHRDLSAAGRHVRVPPRPAVPQPRARRRGESRAGQSAVGVARGDGRAADHRRLRDVSAAAAVHGHGHAEPDRAGRHVSAARSAARSVPAARARELSRCGRRARDPRAQSRRAETLRDRRGAVHGARARRRRKRCSRRACKCSISICRQPLEEYIVQIVLATRSPERYGDDLRGRAAVRREPARDDRARSLLARARLARGPRLRDARGHSGASRTTCCAIASCSASRPRPRAARRTRSSTRCSRGSECPE